MLPAVASAVDERQSIGERRRRTNRVDDMCDPNSAGGKRVCKEHHLALSPAGTPMQTVVEPTRERRVDPDVMPLHPRVRSPLGGGEVVGRIGTRMSIDDHGKPS
jgi:hypothetical protein